MADTTLPRIRVPHPHVRVDAAVLGGSPHVVGSRVPVRRLWAWHRSGASVETLIKRYPNLGPARIFDALAFAYDNPDLLEADVAREQALLEKHAPVEGSRERAQLSLPFDAAGAPAPGDERPSAAPVDSAFPGLSATSAHSVSRVPAPSSSPARAPAPAEAPSAAGAVRPSRKR